MGMPACQYFMEYGFLGVALLVLWVVFKNYLEDFAREKYRVIIEFANDAILVVQDGKPVFSNPAYRDLVGSSQTDSGPLNLLDVVADKDRRAIIKHYNTLLDNNRPVYPHTVGIKAQNGEERFVEIKSGAIEYDGRRAVLSIMRDVTRRKKEDAARQESERKIARLEKMESIGVLAGGVAHDLNNILTGIVSYPDLILSNMPEDHELRKPIQVMRKNRRNGCGHCPGSADHGQKRGGESRNNEFKSYRIGIPEKPGI